MSFTQRDEALASWLAQVSSAIGRRYGCRHFPNLEISEGRIIARCSNQGIASTVWQLRQTLIESGEELSVYWGWRHFGSTCRG